MTTITKTILGAAFGVLATAGIASAATVDTIDATSGQAGTYFVPSLGQETISPYYRSNGEDWDWQHNAIAAGFTSAKLNISAYDVDEGPVCGGFQPNCELDVIQAYDAGTTSWVTLGSLSGDDNAFSFTEFDIYAAAGGSLIDDIQAGLQVRMLIDENDTGWFVSLAKSVISTDGMGPGNPNPGQVPLPAGAWLMLTAVGGFAAMRRRKKA